MANQAQLGKHHAQESCVEQLKPQGIDQNQECYASRNRRNGEGNFYRVVEGLAVKESSLLDHSPEPCVLLSIRPYFLFTHVIKYLETYGRGVHRAFDCHGPSRKIPKRR